MALTDTAAPLSLDACLALEALFLSWGVDPKVHMTDEAWTTLHMTREPKMFSDEWFAWLDLL